MTNFIYTAGFDEFTDTNDLIQNEVSFNGTTDDSELLPDATFGVPNGKYISSTRTLQDSEIGLVRRAVPLPLVANGGGVCCGGTVIVPDDADAFDGINFVQHPLFRINNCILRMGTGALGTQNKLVLFVQDGGEEPDTNQGNIFESEFEFLPGGVYFVSIAIEPASGPAGNDGRVIVRANKSIIVDTGANVNLGNPNQQELTRIATIDYYAPSRLTAWGWDNLFCVDSSDEPPFFYVEQVPINTVDRMGWDALGAAADDKTALSDSNDATGILTDSHGIPARFTFEQSPVHFPRLTDEVALRVRMSRGNNALANAEVVVHDGVTQFGSQLESVAGGSQSFVEQVIRVKLTNLRQLRDLNFDLYNRPVD